MLIMRRDVRLTNRNKIPGATPIFSKGLKLINAILAVYIIAASSLTAQAASLGDVFNVISNVQRAAQQDRPAGSNNSEHPAIFGSNRSEPDWLTRYPRASLSKEFVNPFDTVSIPLTMPSVDATTTRYAVPMEGKVTMLQYRHEADDSLLLIQRHYDAILAQQGFERVIVCAKPCPSSGGAAHWMKMLDPNSKVDYFNFPVAPQILIGYKANAMVFVAIGKNPNLPYASFIKLVEGTITNRSDLNAWLASLKPAEPPAPAVPAMVAQQPYAYVPHETATQSDIVENISPTRLQSAIAQTRGRLIVLLSSRDKNCSFCVRAIPRYAELASKRASAGRFVMVTWEPWGSAFKHDFLRAHEILALPTYLTFMDGKLDARADGNLPVATLENKLIDQPQHR